MLKHWNPWIIAAIFVTLIGCASRHPSTAKMDMAGPDASAASHPEEKLGWRLGCQAYTFRAMTLFETLDVLKKLDIHYVELFPGQRLSPEHPLVVTDHHLPANFIELMKQKLKDTGVKAVNYGVVGLPNDEAEARKVFDFAKTMGLETIVSEPPEDAFEMLDRLANEYKINVAIHDHPKPSHYWNCDTVLKVREGRSHRIGSCADVGHWYTSGLVPLDCIKKLQGRIISLHFKERTTEKKDAIFGQGECNLAGILDELHRQNFKGVFSIEYESSTGQELIDNVGKSIAFFRQHAGALAAQAH